MAIKFWDEWKNSAGVTEMHVWLGDDSVPARPRHRARDASAGAVGETHMNAPLPSDPDTPPEQSGRQDQFPGPNTTGGLPTRAR